MLCQYKYSLSVLGEKKDPLPKTSQLLLALTKVSLKGMLKINTCSSALWNWDGTSPLFKLGAKVLADSGFKKGLWK